MSTSTQRKLNVNVSSSDSDKKPIPKAIKELARQVFLLNKEQNAAKTSYDKKRKELYSAMKDAGIDSFPDTMSVDGKAIAITTEISSSKSSECDVKKLLEIVGNEKFMEIVSASKTAVEAKAGTEVATRCFYTVIGNENVSIKATK